MKIIICGGGGVGASIAHQLSLENNDVTVIDIDQNVITEVTEHLDVRGITGFPSYPSVLEDAGIREADALIAVTRSDEVNMIICQVAYSLFETPLRIARIRGKDYLRPEWQMLYRQDHIPIDYIISPEQQVARAIYDRLCVPGSVDTITLAGDTLMAIGVKCAEGSEIPGQPFSDVQQMCASQNAAMLGVVRDGLFILPHSEKHIDAHDIIYVVCSRKDSTSLMVKFGHSGRKMKDVVIIGAGNIGMFLTEYLGKDERNIRIRLIEHNSDRADTAASRFTGNRTTVLHGDAMSEALMRDAGIERADQVIAVTEDDKVNILTCFIAKKNGAARTAAIINSARTFAPMLTDAGIDITVNPREITVSSILRYIRTGKVLSLRSMCFGKVELLEIIADAASPVTGKDIKHAGLPHGTIISAICRQGTLIHPDEDTVIKEGDLLTVLCEADSVHKTEEIFASRKEFY